MLLLSRALADCLYEIRVVYQGRRGEGKKKKAGEGIKIRQCHRASDSRRVTCVCARDTPPRAAQIYSPVQAHVRARTHAHALLMTQTHNIKPNAATKICMVLSNALVNITWQSVHTGLIGF